MLLKALDGDGIQQLVVVQSQEALVDYSGTGNGAAQTVLATNLLRSGYILQNQSPTNQPLFVNDTGVADPIAAGSFEVGPGQYFPPPGYPLTTNAISVFAANGDAYTIREW